MSKTDPGTHIRWLLPMCATSAVLLAPLMQFMKFHEFPLISAPVGLLLLASLLVGLCVSLFELMSVPIMASFILSATMTFSLDYIIIDSFVSHFYGHLFVLVVMFVVLATLNMLMRPNSYQIVFFSFLSMSLVPSQQENLFYSTYTHAEQGSVPVSGESPKITLHLVLDEHIGLAGIPAGIPGAVAVRERIVDFYADHGFSLSSHVYSRYMDTPNSIGNLLNFGSSATHGQFFDVVQDPIEHIWFGDNAYFRKKTKEGIDIHVYQASWLQYCDQGSKSISLCVNYPSNSIASIADLPISTWRKSAFILRSFVQESTVHYAARFYYQSRLRPILYASTGLLVPAWANAGHKTGPIPVHALLDDITADVQGTRVDRLIFAHLLTPHYPYVYNQDCSIRTDTTWLDRDSSEHATANNTEPTRRIRYSQYFDQINCLYSRLDTMLDSFESQGILDDLTIIIHGDHGSRITLVDPGAAPDQAVASDYLDAYSTHYAVKGPGVRAGINGEIVPLERIFSLQAGVQPDAEVEHFVLIKHPSHEFSRIDGSPFDRVEKQQEHSSLE